MTLARTLAFLVALAPLSAHAANRSYVGVAWSAAAPGHALSS